MGNELVFVYGTLRYQGSNGHRLGAARRLGDATIQGCLYRIDWYPGLVLGLDGIVFGEVYEVAPCDIAALDTYEGSEYLRIKAEVTMANGKICEAWVWEYQESIEGLERIVSGNWLTE